MSDYLRLRVRKMAFADSGLAGRRFGAGGSPIRGKLTLVDRTSPQLQGTPCKMIVVERRVPLESLWMRAPTAKVRKLG